MSVEKRPPPMAEPDDKVYAAALSILVGPGRRLALFMRLLNAAYWLAILGGLGWLLAMAIDREVPIQDIKRDLLTAQVRPGEKVLIRAARTRVRLCEVTRRWSIIDGSGRRTNYEPERFDAYGALGRDTGVEGPIIPLDASPGRGRFQSVTAFDCNLLQRALGWSITYVAPTIEFEILPRW